jgi:drug/metabolite transporter (DMT)-like permease
MGKKGNTALFIIIATLVNILLMMILFIIGFYLLVRFADPESSMVPVYLALVFFFAIGGSFVLYSKLVSWASKRFNLEDKIVPLFGNRRRRPPKRD